MILTYLRTLTACNLSENPATTRAQQTSMTPTSCLVRREGARIGENLSTPNALDYTNSTLRYLVD